MCVQFFQNVCGLTTERWVYKSKYGSRFQKGFVGNQSVRDLPVAAAAGGEEVLIREGKRMSGMRLTAAEIAIARQILVELLHSLSPLKNRSHLLN